MGIFDKQLATVRRFPEAIERAIRKTIEENEKMLLDYIRTEQLRKNGVDGSGNKLGQYQEGYARIRIARNLQVAHIDLRFTGKLFASMRINAMQKQAKVTIDVPYDKELVERFGKDFLKIQREYLMDFANKKLLPAIKQEINDQIAKSRSA